MRFFLIYIVYVCIQKYVSGYSLWSRGGDVFSFPHHFTYGVGMLRYIHRYIHWDYDVTILTQYVPRISQSYPFPRARIALFIPTHTSQNLASPDPITTHFHKDQAPPLSNTIHPRTKFRTRARIKYKLVEAWGICIFSPVLKTTHRAPPFRSAPPPKNCWNTDSRLFGPHYTKETTEFFIRVLVQHKRRERIPWHPFSVTRTSLFDTRTPPGEIPIDSHHPFIFDHLAPLPFILSTLLSLSPPPIIINVAVAVKGGLFFRALSHYSYPNIWGEHQLNPKSSHCVIRP